MVRKSSRRAKCSGVRPPQWRICQNRGASGDLDKEWLFHIYPWYGPGFLEAPLSLNVQVASWQLGSALLRSNNSTSNEQLQELDTLCESEREQHSVVSAPAPKPECLRKRDGLVGPAAQLSR